MNANEKNQGSSDSAEKKVDELYSLIKGIEVAMMTTRLDDGQLVSRPMATQDQRPGVDLWFMTTTDTHKVEEIGKESNVNLGYLKDGEWVSVSGIATLSQDRARIRELYKPSWKAWLADEGGDKNGGPDDPRIMLIEVRALSVNFFKRSDSRPVTMFKVLSSMITGEPPKLGETRQLKGDELRASPRH